MCYNLRRNPCLTSVNILYFCEKCHFCLNSERGNGHGHLSLLREKTPHSGRRRIHCGKRTSHPSGSRRNTALQRTTSGRALPQPAVPVLQLDVILQSFLIGAVIFFCLVIPGGPPACPKGIDCVNLLILATALFGHGSVYRLVSPLFPPV